MAAPPPAIDISSPATSTHNPLPVTSHRLPTQSAATALESLSDSISTSIATGLSSLDRGLVWGPCGGKGGLDRGKVTELWGPSGSGKTGLALGAAIGAIMSGEHAVWVDCSALLSGARFKSALAQEPELRSCAANGSDTTILDRFHHISVPTLSHLLALVVHPPSMFLPANTALLVIDDVNTLVDIDYPRYQFNSNSRTEPQKWQAGRRYAVLGSLVTALNKLAALHNMAVIVTSGCSSRMRRDDGLPAGIGPGVGGSEWDSGICSRVVLFRDFSGRFVGIQKCQGRNITPLDPVGDVRNAIGFETTPEGRLKGPVIDLTSSEPSQVVVRSTKFASSPVRIVRKRAYEEIADSEDEDLDEYGWAEADDAIAANGLQEQNKSATLNDQTT